MSPDADESPKANGIGIDSLARASVGIGALLYLFGYLATAIHLSRYGITSLTLVKAQYALAGTWLLVPLVSTLCLVAWLYASIEDEYQKRPIDKTLSLRKRLVLHSRHVLWGSVPVVGWVFIAFLAVMFAFKLSPTELVVVLPLETVLILLGASLGLMIVSFCSWLFIRDAVSTPDFRSRARDFGWGLTFVSFLAFGVAAYARFFVENVFAQIPVAIGGGRPTVATLVFKEDPPALLLKYAGVSASAPSRRELDALLLQEDEKSLIVLLEKSPTRAFVIARDLLPVVSISFAQGGDGVAPRDDSTR